MFKAASTTLQGRRNSKPVWILVADAGRARLLECASGPDGKLTEVEDFVSPAARLHEHDVVADRKGRMHGVGGIGQSFEPRHTQADNEADHFARDLCERLETARQKGQVGAVYLIAAPSFLGVFRKHLEPATRLLVREEIASDLTRKPVSEIRKVLPTRV